MPFRSWLDRLLGAPEGTLPASVPVPDTRPFPPSVEDETCRIVTVGEYQNRSVSAELFQKYQESGTYGDSACVVYVPFKVIGERFARYIANTCYMLSPKEVSSIVFVMGESRVVQCANAATHGMTLLHDFSAACAIEHVAEPVIAHHDITTRAGYCLTGQEDDHPWSYFGEVNEFNARKIALQPWPDLLRRVRQLMVDGYSPREDPGLYTFPKAMELLTFGKCDPDFPVSNGEGIADLAYHVNTPNDDLNRFEDYRLIKVREQEISDILELWERYLFDNSITMALRRPSSDYAAQIARIDEMIGIESAIEAYYEGVPKDYLLAELS